MFYTADVSEVLRLGDVVRGYISTYPNIIGPHVFTTPPEDLCSVDVDFPSYSVVLSPCCSIEDGVICLTPLIKINNRIMQLNPYFKEDPIRINTVVEPQYTAPPSVWKSTGFRPKKLERLATGRVYVFLHYFTYKGDGFFEEYNINMTQGSNITTNNYMIDFRKIYSLQCPMIKRQSDLTASDLPLTQSKYLQLSVETREQLRNKLSYYFGRPAPEDDAVIGSH